MSGNEGKRALPGGAYETHFGNSGDPLHAPVIDEGKREKDMSEKKDLSSRLLGSVAVLTAIGSIITGSNSFTLKNIEHRANETRDAIKTQIEMQKAERDDRSFSIDHFFKVYDLAVSAANDPVKIEFLNVLVTSTFDLDGAEGNYWLAYLKILEERAKALESANPTDAKVKLLATKLSNNVIATNQAMDTNKEGTLTAKPGTGPSSEGLGSFVYDVFQCETGKDLSSQFAEKLSGALKQRTMNFRMRILPDSVNAAPGYRRSGFLVMVDPNNTEEQQYGNRVAGIATNATGMEFVVRSTSGRSPTPNYISLFICPNSGY